MRRILWDAMKNLLFIYFIFFKTVLHEVARYETHRTQKDTFKVLRVQSAKSLKVHLLKNDCGINKNTRNNNKK